MQVAQLEHVNITVRDPAAIAERLQRLLDWRVRWQGQASDGGHTVHVGTEDSYLALYAPTGAPTRQQMDNRVLHRLNHIAVVVDDLNECERRMLEECLEPGSREIYEPGERFYVMLDDDLELEVVSYAG